MKKTPQGHCPICLILDKCWFDDKIKPKMPQHPMCHCSKKYILPPVANATSKAECALNKFKDYIFSDKYLWNDARAAIKNSDRIDFCACYAYARGGNCFSSSSLRYSPPSSLPPPFSAFLSPRKKATVNAAVTAAAIASATGADIKMPSIPQ